MAGRLCTRAQPDFERPSPFDPETLVSCPGDLGLLKPARTNDASVPVDPHAEMEINDINRVENAENGDGGLSAYLCMRNKLRGRTNSEGRQKAPLIVSPGAPRVPPPIKGEPPLDSPFRSLGRGGGAKHSAAH